MCDKGLQSQCETTQVREQDTGAALFGYTKLYGQVPGGQAEYLRVPQAQYGPIKVPEGPPDDRFVYLSDVLPTAWQAVDLVPERIERARSHGVEVLDLEDFDNGDLPAAVREMTDGRGPVSVIDAVGMEAHGAPVGKLAHKIAAMLPDAIAAPMTEKAGIDRLSALYSAIEIAQRGGTISLSGVYGGAASPMPLIELFDKQINLRMGQANVRRWVPDLLPLVEGDDDPLGVEGFATHHVPLEDAPAAYETFQKKEDNAFKVVSKP